ncbi:MAG: hypothetical protein H6718_20160 [Polyangiaceae bacterium]|nr:hypothetical protein [Myxococcales bacterium]MCB9587728.1 hypothetical protein [Polyangiaceae bacterium]
MSFFQHSSSRGWLSLALALGVCAGGCKEDPAPGATASASATEVASAAPPPKPKPWYEGDWSGEYDATHYLIEMEAKDGAIRNWKDDDGKSEAGKGKISLTIDEAGEVSGKLSGPLGEMSATGSVEGETLSVRLTPDAEDAKITTAYFLADKKGEGLEGKLQASSGDSLMVRDAKLTLAKGGAGAAKAPDAPAAPEAPTPAPSVTAE